VRFLRMEPFAYYNCQYKDKKTGKECQCQRVEWKFVGKAALLLPAYSPGLTPVSASPPLEENNSGDVQGRYCDCCGHPPQYHSSYFNKHIINPINANGNEGNGRDAFLTLKHEVLDKLLLRRTKAPTPCLAVPENNVHVRLLPRSPGALPPLTLTLLGRRAARRR
jgi:hypothetical protein